jgi:peptidoglycan/LPS O-acetylase OafA/YrhL
MHWFNQHLNWSWIIGISLAAIISFFVMAVWMISSPSTKELTIFLRVFPAYYLVIIAVSIWVLFKKGRSLWWLFFIWIYSPLWLENKKEGPEWTRYLNPGNKQIHKKGEE